MTTSKWTKLPRPIVYNVNRKDDSLTLAGADMDERHPGNPQWSVNINWLITNGHYTWSRGTAVSPEGRALRGSFGYDSLLKDKVFIADERALLTCGCACNCIMEEESNDDY